MHCALPHGLLICMCRDAGPLPLPFGAREMRGDYTEGWKEILDGQVRPGVTLSVLYSHRIPSLLQSEATQGMCSR